MDVFVSGLGVVSAMGCGVERQLQALKSGKTGIAPYEFSNGKIKYQGKLKLSNTQLKEKLGISLGTKMPRTALLGMVAAQEAISLLPAEALPDTGFINGSTTGGMDLSEDYFIDKINNDSSENINNLLTHDLGTVNVAIRNFLGLKGYTNTISTACSSAANAVMLGSRMIQAGMIDRVLVGGTDALTDFTINGFTSLMIYDTEFCRPFDEERVGLNLGEGAGYILLENAKSLEETGSKPLARVTGWANANDSFHQTGTSPDGIGAKKAMYEALEVAKLSIGDIDYLNAHGTATKNNDNSEIAAIDGVFEGSTLDFSSTKGFTGHTLAAAGGIEAVFSILSMTESIVFPNINWKNQMAQSERAPVLKEFNKTINHVMSNSFGFGGNSTSLIFSKA
ncbi:MAG: beta-ketoacyl-[acyl-carrier-protein] synthase family protein [Reichenbachiella sp.]